VLTLLFIILVYSFLLKNSDLNIIKATAQHWMLNGIAGIRYRIVFAPKAFIKNISIDEVWIKNRLYKISSQSSSSAIAVHLGNTDDEMILSVDLKEDAEHNTDHAIKRMQKFLPGDVPIGTGDVVIVYKVGAKRKYHVISQLERLPYTMAN
jgi:hypothetical protein